MKPVNIKRQSGKVQMMFELPTRFGYESILSMAQLVIDNHLSRITSVRVSNLAGMPEHEYKFFLSLRRNIIKDCPQLSKEYGVFFLRGKSPNLKYEFEMVWFNQTNIFGILASSKDEEYFHIFEKLVDSFLPIILS